MISPAIPGAGVVLLAGADDAAVEALRPAWEILESFGVEVEAAVISDGAADRSRFERRSAVIVASPDSTLPAAVASATELPVIRVPTEGGDRRGLALLNDDHGHLPAGIGTGVFATMAIGVAGAKNAALFVISTLALRDERLRVALAGYRARQTDAVLSQPPLEPS